MKKDTVKIISIPDGYERIKEIEVKFLGKGQFSTCYTDGESVYSFVNESLDNADYSKQAIAQWADSDNPHIPNFKILGDIGVLTVYKSTLYSPLTTQNKTAWNQYKILKKVWFNSWRYYYHPKNILEGNYKLIDDLKGLLPDKLIEAIESIVAASANYSEKYRLEFPKRNLAVDSNGNLILLDIIFNQEGMKS